MFFGFSRKRRNRNGNRKKRRTGINKRQNNIKFKVEELDTPPSPSPVIKTVETESMSPIILSDSSSSRRNNRVSTRISNASSRKSRKSAIRHKLEMRTPTPYRRNESDSESEQHADSWSSEKDKQRDSTMSFKGTPKSKSHSLNSSGDIILFFMDMLTTVKLYHWKTFNYATHKATDELYEDLNKYVDEFVEVLIGHKGGVRVSLPRSNVKVHDCASLNEFKSKIEGYKRVLIGFTSRFDGKKNSDLLNIRDEILASLNKTLYLLSFK
jgi:DNA-binding ferritin-like protein